MEGSADDSKIVKPYLPTLMHQACVKMAISFCNEYAFTSLFIAFRKIEEGAPPSSNRLLLCAQKAQEKLLLMPARLRNEIMEAIRGMGYLADKCQRRRLYENYVLGWRYDGAFDGMIAAEKMVGDARIGVRKRFYVASHYCLEECVERLWTEMQESGETEELEATPYCMVSFWVRRMQHTRRVPWRQDILDFFKDPQNDHSDARYSSFFPSLKPEERRRFLASMQCADADDYMLCLYAMTKEEEHEVLKNYPLKLLYVYMEWPFRSLFRETSEKMWKYMDEDKFLGFIKLPFYPPIWLPSKVRINSEFYELYEDFWNRSPIALRESVKKQKDISEKVDSLLNSIRRKRKAHFVEQSNFKQD